MSEEQTAKAEKIERIPILEDWPGCWERWARGYCYRNLWRISHIRGFDLEDAVGEAALVWVETVHRYGHKVNSPAHMMRLYQMSLSSWFNDLSVKDSQGRTALAKLPTNEPVSQSNAYLTVLLSQGSKELKEVISVFLNAPPEIMETLRADTVNDSAKHFWNVVLQFCHISVSRSEELRKELTDLLS